MPNSLERNLFRDTRRFELLVRGITDFAIYMLDPDGIVTSWNAGAEKIKGYPENEIVGEHFSIFFTAEDVAAGLPQRILKEAGRSGRFESEGWRVRKDGARFWANAVADAIYDGGKLVGFAKITRDLSDRRKVQQALSESEDRFRMLVNAVVDYAIYTLDPSGTITSWNTGAERLKGYTTDEIVGQHFSLFYTKEDRALALPIRALEIARTEGRYESEGWRIRKDGSRFWASAVIDAVRDPQGAVIGFAKITRDVTERQLAHEALRDSERQFRLLVKGVRDYALFMLDPQGVIVNWNAGAELIKGYSAEEVVGSHFSRFYTETDRRAGLPVRALQEARLKGRFHSEGWRVRKDGSTFWADATLDAIRDEAGQLIGFAKITRDITERRESQLALQSALLERDHAQRLEALGKLTGGVAHDFNNLLMIVSGHLETIKRSVGDSRKAQRAVDAIDQATKRGASLTRQLLAFARRQTLQPQQLNVPEQIAALKTLVEASIGATISLTVEMHPQLWTIHADPNELELALLNIVVNAKDAMPHGGRITISAQNKTLPDGDIKSMSGEFVLITVTDTGHGMAPDIQNRAFEPFFSTKGPDRGTGLGLSQVYGFAHQSGGLATLHSAIGAGTTVSLYLPRGASERLSKNEVTKTGPAKSGLALVVDDNPDVAKATASLLEVLGYTVLVRNGGSAALEAFASHDVSLIVSDIVMAGEVNGLGLARKLRAERPELPILLITGYTDQLAEAEAEFPVLRKPFQLLDLDRALSRAMAEATDSEGGKIVRLRLAHPKPHSTN